MAKTNNTENKETQKPVRTTTPRTTKATTKESDNSKKFSLWNETWAILLAGIALIGFGFGVGYWVANNDSKIETMQLQIDCDKRIEAEKKEWVKEQKSENSLEELKVLITNISQNKEVNYEKK